MIPAGQSMITAAALAEELGVDDSTLSRWRATRPALAAAKWSRRYYLVQPLRDAGILPRLSDLAPARSIA